MSIATTLEVGNLNLSDISKKMGKTTLASNVVRLLLKLETRYETKKAWNELENLSSFMEDSLKTYLIQGNLSKSVLDHLDDVLELDHSFPPASPYKDTFIFPSERRIKHMWNALEYDEKNNGIKKETFGEYLSRNPNIRDHIFYLANKTWEKIDDIRALVLEHINDFSEEHEIEETKAWELFAPEAMQLANRFMMMTAHPWSKTEAYKQNGTIFSHAIRKEAWLIERWQLVAKKNKGNRNAFAMQNGAEEQEIKRWCKYCSSVNRNELMQRLVSNNDAWNTPHAVALALIKNGNVDELVQWIDNLKIREKEDGKFFDINLQNLLLSGKTLLDYALEESPIENKKEIVQLLIDKGAEMNSFERNGVSDYTLLLKSTPITSFHEAKEWVNWISERSCNASLSFNADGVNEFVLALQEKEIEWAAALLSLAKDGDSMSIDGKNWYEHWKEFKVKNADFGRNCNVSEHRAMLFLEGLSEKNNDQAQTLFEIQGDNFWCNLDKELERFPTIQQKTQNKKGMS